MESSVTAGAPAMERRYDNPYLEEYLAATASPAATFDFTAALDDLSATDMWDELTSPFDLRWELCHRYAWAIPSAAAIDTLVELAPIVEIGAGAGYWASLVDAAGGDIIAYDVAPVDTGENDYVGDHVWFDVHPGGIEAVGDHQDRTLFLCWPPCSTVVAGPCLELYEGDTVVYVGESWGGCTADPMFFDLLGERFERTALVQIPRWDGVGDAMWVYHRRR